MNMHYSHGLIKVIARQKYIGRVIKLRIQGERREESESRKAKKQDECATLIKVPPHGRV